MKLLLVFLITLSLTDGPAPTRCTVRRMRHGVVWMCELNKNHKGGHKAKTGRNEVMLWYVKAKR